MIKVENNDTTKFSGYNIIINDSSEAKTQAAHTNIDIDKIFSST
jgi:hypothetical protein